jgi:acyl carrier protein
MTGNGATFGSMDTERVFATLTEIVGGIIEMDPADLRRDQRIDELSIDSLYAAEILAQTERSLGVNIDFGNTADDWTGLTLGGLADKIAANATPISA